MNDNLAKAEKTSKDSVKPLNGRWRAHLMGQPIHHYAPASHLGGLNMGGRVHMYNNHPNEHIYNQASHRSDSHLYHKLADASENLGARNYESNDDEDSFIPLTQLSDMILEHVEHRVATDQAAKEKAKSEQQQQQQQKQHQQGNGKKHHHHHHNHHHNNHHQLRAEHAKKLSSTVDNQALSSSESSVTLNSKSKNSKCKFEYNSTVGNIISQQCEFPIRKNTYWKKMAASECGLACHNDKSCTHFSYIEGKCYLQTGSVSRFDAQSTLDSNSFCGFAGVRDWTVDDDAQWSDNCNFLDWSSSVKITQPVECAKLCQNLYSLGCTHFVALADKTCFLMTGAVNTNKEAFIQINENNKKICGLSRSYFDKINKN